MKVLVTGATGFVGLEVVKKFLEAGCEVVATGRNVREWRRNAPENKHLEFIAADLADGDQCRKLPTDADCVVHCAALSSPWGDFDSFRRANLVSLDNLLQRVGDGGFVHISSSSVNYKLGARVMEREDDNWSELAPNNYVATKREAERVVRSKKPDAVILRPHAIMGERDPSIIPRVMRVAKRGVFPLIGSDIRMDTVHVDDVAKACLLAASSEKARGCTYNIAGGDPVSRRLALRTLFSAANMKVRMISLNSFVARGMARLLEGFSNHVTGGRWEPPLTTFSVNEISHEVLLDISKARRDFGFCPQNGNLESMKKIGWLWRQK
jgi:nucleoside-diphosphate-sugar epimerase